MPSAFVLINCQSRFTPDVIESLRELPEVEEAYKTQGMYDVIAKLRSDNENDFRESIVRLRRVANIRSTLTMIVVPKEERVKEELTNEDTVAEYERQHPPPPPSSAFRDSTTK